MDSDTPVEADVKVCVLASGSKGNAIYVSDGATAVLLDAGLSGIEIERRMRSRGLEPSRLDAIVVTHEHADHLKGVGVLSRRYRLPVHISSGTYSAAAGVIGKLACRESFSCGSSFVIGGLRLHPFATSHDAADPAGFTIQSGRFKLGLATDLGIATGMVRHHLQSCDLLILESNHDPVMLEHGPYPWPLKQRIRSRSGHLSNEDAVRLLREVMHPHLKHVVMAHLSETNNTPDRVRCSLAALMSQVTTCMHIASQDVCSALISIR